MLYSATGVRAEASRRIVILCPEHKTYLAAAESCAEVLKEKGHHSEVIKLPGEPAAIAGSCHSCHKFTTSTSAQVVRGPASSQPADLGPLSRPADVPPADLVIALGDEAALAALINHPQEIVVFGMVSNIHDSTLVMSDELKSRTVGVTTDINPVEQIKWLRRFTPKVKDVCVPHSDRSVHTAKAIEKAGAELGIRITLIETSKDDFAHAVDELSRKKCDAVLMIADAQIYNVVTIKRLLLWGIRQHKPIWTFSENFVKAGALGCLSAEPRDIGRETAAIALRVLEGTSPAAIGVVYPSRVSPAYNERTAKLIDLKIPDGALVGVTVLGREE